MSSSFFLSALAATFAVSGSAVTCPAVPRDATFDDISAIPATALTPVPDPYDGLDFQAFDVVNVVKTDLLPGVLPHSSPNYAAAGLQSETLGGTPTLTVNYPSSNVDSFTLENFYFACVTQAANGITALPAQCNVAITGYRGSDNSVSNAQQVCSQQFEYNPSTLIGAQQMAYSGAVEGCSNIQFAVIQFTPPGGAAATSPLLAFLIDNVEYTTIAKSC